MRVKSEVFIRAYLRLCQAQGVPVVIAFEDSENAGPFLPKAGAGKEYAALI